MPSHFRRVIWIVLDSLGVGAMPDAAEYGDAGSNTLGHIAAEYALKLPFLEQHGLGNIAALPGLMPTAKPLGAFGKCALLSPGKDSTTGHWEMAGIILEEPFPLFPLGFPPEIVEPFENAIGRSILGNKTASGTEIVNELGEEHCRTGCPIVYTSADSVFQVAAHEDVIATKQLYAMCEKARELLTGKFNVARVIARPFQGTAGHFVRTAGRRDYSVAPPEGMLLDQLQKAHVPVTAIGKISDLFDNRGIDRSHKTKNNADGMVVTERILAEQTDGLIWLNLVDFDQLYGHRNDVEGYAEALEAVDAWLSTLSLKPDDLVVITADHGCDPTTKSTDHSREYTPLIVYGDCVRAGVALGTRSTLADIGQTVAQNFGLSLAHGQSALQQIWKG